MDDRSCFLVNVPSYLERFASGAVLVFVSVAHINDMVCVLIYRLQRACTTPSWRVGLTFTLISRRMTLASSSQRCWRKDPTGQDHELVFQARFVKRFNTAFHVGEHFERRSMGV